MADDKVQSGGNQKQKLTIAIFMIVIIVIIWQAWGLFGGSSGSSEPTPSSTALQHPATATGHIPGENMPSSSQPIQPNTAQLMSNQRNSQISSREAELLQLQRETQAKYLAAINELQMLRIQKEIAETNQAIVKAKLDTVTAQKGIVDLFVKPATPSINAGAYASGLVSPVGSGSMVATPVLPGTEAAPPSYVVLSVSYLMNKWHAVIGYQGKLYMVSVGDVLPVDGSIVVSINKSGIMLATKEGPKRKISLVQSI